MTIRGFCSKINLGNDTGLLSDGQQQETIVVRPGN